MVRRIMLGVALGVVSASLATAAVLCRTHSGTVKLRDACKPTEAQVDPIALGLQGPAGPQGPTGATGPPGPGLAVKDVNDALVGVEQDCEVNGFGNFCAVRLLGDVLVRLRVTRDGFADTGAPGESPYYEDPSCSGQPFGLFGSVLGFTGDFRSLVVTPFILGTIAYYPRGPADVIAVQAHTQFLSQQDCLNSGGTLLAPNTCCVPDSHPYELAPLARFDLSTLGLVAPFHVE